jgi:acyl-CoA thioester hydrolase
MSNVFSHVFRVRYAEVDLQAVVFNSRYLEYADLLITEYWRSIGLHFAGEGALEFHVVRAEIDFRAPLRADELLEGRVRTERLGSSSVTTRITLHGAEAPEEDLRAEILLVHVHVDLDSGNPQPVPAAARELLAAGCAGS